MTDSEGEGLDLEFLCYHYGNGLYSESVRSADSSAFFLSALRSAVIDRSDYFRSRRSVFDFLVDSYVFYRRHREEDVVVAKELCLRDTYAYMMSLANGCPVLVRRNNDRWWPE